MLLAAVGDAMGYKNGSWEFNYSSTLIHKDMMQLTNGKGPLHLKISLDWRYSDDTVMHIATAQGLTQSTSKEDVNVVSKRVAKEYKKCSKCMAGRAPGKTCMKTLSIIDEDASNWNKIPYSQLKGGGCGASMRAACIGLFYQQDITKLIAVSIETGRITHHNPVGYLGALVSAYFTYLAIKAVPPEQWIGKLFTEALPLAREHIDKVGREVDLNLNSGQWAKFVESWQKYAQERGLSMTLENCGPAKFPEKYGIIER
jgi:ADP-ribosylarginine hydrolase